MSPLLKSISITKVCFPELFKMIIILLLKCRNVLRYNKVVSVTLVHGTIKLSGVFPKELSLLQIILTQEEGLNILVK